MFRLVNVAAALALAHGFVVPNAIVPTSSAACERRGIRMGSERPPTRAEFLAVGAALSASGVALSSPHPAVADAPTSEVKKVPLQTGRLGGQLEPFADVTKAYRLAKPLGWNRYDGEGGEYVVKMTDIVDPTQVILLTNSPVKSDTELTSLGSLSVVAEKLGKSRGMELVASRDRMTENIRLYDFEFKDGDRRELKTLAVYRNKLWNLTLGCPEKAWTKREDTFKAVATAFLPKL